MAFRFIGTAFWSTNLRIKGVFKLTYIIPVYNSADCVIACLEGIYSLPFNENGFEVIVVDDCSTDNTLDALNDYASKHSNMVVLHQEVNQRQGAARNRGIDIAKGEYIAFCDADDTIVADGVMNALKAVSETKADICYFDFEYETSDGAWQVFEMPKETRNTILAASDYLNIYYTCYYNAPWRNLYRTDFLRKTGVRFVEGVRWEDCDWTVKVYAQAKNIQFVDGVGYRYAFNEKSVSKQRSVKAMSERVYAGLRLIKLGDEVREQMPSLSKTLSNEGKNYYVDDTIRLRNLTKYSSKQCAELVENIGKDHLDALAHYSWPAWDSFFINRRHLSGFFLLFACPLAGVGRKIVNTLRTIRKR